MRIEKLIDPNIDPIGAAAQTSERGLIMRIPIDNTTDLASVETFTPALTPQEQVDAAHRAYLEARIRRLESVCLAAQLYCGMGDARTAAAILGQALTGL